MDTEKAFQALSALDMYDAVVSIMGHSESSKDLLEVVRRAANEAGITVHELRAFRSMLHRQLVDAVRRGES